ncbi:histidine kinase [Devosia yakushimensis]|uniref:Histidine kinase n=1 Tax=Devosia yakushimensis TaxID=470028 RepID=A0ABQ5UAV5_9HYPH|nr:Hpt domain-containing protein [Devosia yakushimensis]GLQ08956.1 histidine kinase [Devosia yakushimensis]
MAQRSSALDRDVAKPARRPARPIDLVHLAKQCLGDAGLEREILHLFDSTIKTYLARLLAATAPDEVLFALHTIRGAAAGVGAFAITDLAKAMEADARAGRAIEVEQIDDLKMAVEEASGFIGDVLGRE